MKNEELTARLNAIAARFYDIPTPRPYEAVSPPFDITRPVIHDSKKDFLCEKRAVEEAIKATNTLIQLVLDQFEAEDIEKKAMAERLCLALNVSALTGAARKRTDSIPAYLIQSAIEQNLMLSSFVLNHILAKELSKRKQELEGQEVEYWSDAHRAPNHYARIIALRFALAIYYGSGTMPTFGIARDGNHPSTEYGRALEEVLELLEIKANVKNAVRWALSKAKEEVKNRPRNTPSGLLEWLSKPLDDANNALQAYFPDAKEDT